MGNGESKRNKKRAKCIKLIQFDFKIHQYNVFRANKY